MKYRLLIILSLAFSSNVLAVTQYREETIPFIQNLSTIRKSIELPTSDKLESVMIPVRKLRKRIYKSEKDLSVEPVNLWLKKDAKTLSEFSTKIAKPGRSLDLHAKILERVKSQKENKNNNVKFTIKKDDLVDINLYKVSELLAKPHHSVAIEDSSIISNKNKIRNLYRQAKLFLTAGQKKKLKTKLMNNETISLRKDLLPRFAKKRLKKYLIHRGPNCFHAALSFQDERLPKSSRVNIKREKGYHKAMINYDELWRAINGYFYEVDTRKAELKFGDLIVFFNIPNNKLQTTNFRWIRHTATYLFDDYTFSKGSKSPNSPYTIKTLSEEWKTWDNYTSKLGVKIYRRNKVKLEKAPPLDSTDWIY